jgi:4-amino-4-deoxy-L-arabinose transferase-like glycosyltransferase
MYVPSFAAEELQYEEGRRAIPAREMLESGDYVLPTIWGAPYLAKPPLTFWSIALFAKLRGGVDEAATRAISLLATLLTCLSIYAVGRCLGGHRTGLASGILFLCTFLVFEKGALGEIEPILGLTAFLATALLWFGTSRLSAPATRSSGRILLVSSGLCLGLALYAKGPPALVFYFAAVLSLGSGLRGLWRPACWVPVLIGTALVGFWVALVLQRLGLEIALSEWWDQLIPEGNFRGKTIGVHVTDRLGMLVGVVGGFLPSSLILLLALRSPTWVEIRDEPVNRFALRVAVLSILVFLVSMHTRPRYVYPVIPWVCLLAGQVLARATEAGGENPLHRRLRGLCTGIGVLGLLPIVAAGVLVFRSVNGIEGISAVGWALVGIIATLAVLLIRGRRVLALHGSLVLCLAIVALGKLAFLTEITPQRADRGQRVATARALEIGVPAGQILHTNFWGSFNELFYVRRTIRYIETPETLAEGDLILVTEAAYRELQLADPSHYELVAEVETDGGVSLVVLRIAGRRP